MKILSLEFNNFVGYSGTHKLNLTSGLNNIRGKNGSGKSNILYSIEWCLDGTASSGIKAGDVIHHGEKTASVTLVTDRGTIVRSQKPNRITVDGETVTQQRLYDIIGAGATSAINACSLNILTATPAARKDMLDDIIGDTGWDEAINKAAAEKDACQDGVELCKKAVYIAVAKAESAAEHVPVDTRKERAASAKQQEKHAKDVMRESIDRECDMLRQQVDTLNEQLGMCKDRKELAVKEAAKVLKDAQNKYDALPDLCEPALANIDIEEAQGRLSKSRRYLDTYREKLRSDHSAIYNLTSGTHCSQCGSELKSVDADAVSKLQARIIPTKKMFDQYEERVSEARDALNNEMAKEKENARIMQEYRKLQSMEERAAMDVELARKALSTEKHRDFTAPILEGIKKAQTNLTAAAASYDQKLSAIDYSDEVNSIMNEPDPIANHNNAVKALFITVKEAENDLENATSSLDKYTAVCAAFREASVMPYRDLCADISRRIQHYAANVLEGWSVDITIENETASSIQRKINAGITDADGNAVKWRSLSEGQKQRLALAANFAMIDIATTGEHSNVEFYDEQLSKVDTEAKNSILDLLKLRADETNRSIYVMEHTATGYPFDSVISVVRNNGASTFSTTTEAL